MWRKTIDDEPIGNTREEAYDIICEEISAFDLITEMAMNISSEDILNRLYEKHIDIFYKLFADEIQEAEASLFEEYAYETEEDIDDAKIAMHESLGENWW